MKNQEDGKENERRNKQRFPLHRELRFKLLEDGVIREQGVGKTADIGSGGVAFSVDRYLTLGAYIELSISWPVLLDDNCPMRLIVFGRVLRSTGTTAACSIDKYEFRTQARTFQPATVIRNDSGLQRWVDGLRKESIKLRAVGVA